MKVTKIDTEILNELLKFSENILHDDYSTRIITATNNDIVTQIITNFNKHADKLLLASTDINSNKKFDISDFIDVISSFANHDFNQKISATGINMLGDELEQSVVSKHELEKERNQLNQAQSIAKIGSWEYNLLTSTLTGSRELYRIYELEEISSIALEEAFKQRYHPEDLNTLLLNIENAIEKDTGFHYEHRILNKDGSMKYLSGICETIKNETKKIIGVKGTVQDITARKLVEIELTKSFNIVNEQNKRLLNFSYIVSHNLRSHVSNIQSLLSLFELTKSKKEKDVFIQHLKTVSGLLDETMFHLQEVVSIQNNTNLLVESLNLYKYVNQTIDVLSQEISLKKALIKNNIPKEITVNYNAAYLESIILNFLSNAIKYSDSNRAPIILVDYIKDKNILQITDNGVGIDLEKYGDKLFGMYKIFHGNKDAKGIGLFISKNQIEAMGGKIEVISELNKGTTFNIHIK
jgi:PAS domain-containing protein